MYKGVVTRLVRIRYLMFLVHCDSYCIHYKVHVSVHKTKVLLSRLQFSYPIADTFRT